MPERIHLDAQLPPLSVTASVLNEMAGHARETLPEECCGLVSGDESVRFRRVHRCRNEMTRMHQEDPVAHPRDGREAFYMNEHDYLAAMRQAESEGEKITAVYHSHPGTGLYFSELDQAFANQELFPFPDADHIVISIHDGKVEAGLFQRTGDGFVGRVLLAAPS
jgi:proteasome lid subunit RPN8/RPN11